MTTTLTPPVVDADTALRSELLDVIRWGMHNQPRTLQTRIGPSEIGTTCARKVGHKLAGTATVNHCDPWLSTIGTAVHAWLADVFRDAAGEPKRWMVEFKVPTGRINGQDVEGTCDLYHIPSRTVVDWKTTGTNRLRDYVRNGPGQQYRVQAHDYGRGWVALGMPVERVALMFLPRGEPLSKAHLWSEPFDATVPEPFYQRANNIAALIGALGPAAIPMLPTADAYCSYCNYFDPAASDLTRGCPGDDTWTQTNRSAASAPLTALIAPTGAGTKGVQA